RRCAGNTNAHCIMLDCTVGDAVTVVQLAKYQALGNDYLLLELPADEDGVVRALPQLCDRHRGVGADGLLLFDSDRMAVRIFNPDGSEAERSGNGLRIAACHAD